MSNPNIDSIALRDLHDEGVAVNKKILKQTKIFDDSYDENQDELLEKYGL